jgi:hypothetical protein
MADDAEEQEELFPELDASNKKHKDVLKAAKAYDKAKAERDKLLTTSKENVDAKGEQLLKKMHECGLKKFKFKGTEAEIIETREKVVVKIGSEDAGDDAGE